MSNRRVLLFGSTPRLLQPVFSSPEEGWEFASYTRSAQTELIPLQREIQDADAQEHSFPGPRRGLVHHGRPEGCLLPHPGGSEAQEVPQVRLRGKAYKYKVLLFGLALAPKTFKCMDAALAPLRLQGIRILNYLDDWLQGGGATRFVSGNESCPSTIL